MHNKMEIEGGASDAARPQAADFPCEAGRMRRFDGQICSLSGKNAAEAARTLRYVNCKEVRDRRDGTANFFCVRLWALDNAPDGDLSALPPRQLAEICQFNARRAGELAAALRTSGFVDADGRLHDWGDYTGRLIDQRAANRERQRRRRARLRAAMEESKEDGT